NLQHVGHLHHARREVQVNHLGVDAAFGPVRVVPVRDKNLTPVARAGQGRHDLGLNELSVNHGSSYGVPDKDDAMERGLLQGGRTVTLRDTTRMRYDSRMVSALKRTVTVQPGGLIEIRSDELPPGALAEVIILLADPKNETQAAP